MDKQKRSQYKLTGSIHTVNIKSNGIIDNIQEDVSDCIYCRSHAKNSGVETTSRINPNKLLGNLYTYSEFQTALDTILAGTNITDYTLVRADMRFDSFNDEHYLAYAKLNRYLISALAVTYNVNNVYRTTDLFKQRQLSVAIKNKYFEIENYDKDAESNGTDIAKSRLEERSKSLKNTNLKQEFTQHWFTRWDKAIQNLSLVHRIYNENLEKIYKEDKDAFPKKFGSLTDFLIQYQDCIFCKEQLIDLLSRFEEVADPKTRAENHKKRCGIEYFSKQDVLFAVNEIKKATLEFFNN